MVDTINMIMKSTFLNIFSIIIFYRISSNRLRELNNVRKLLIFGITIILSVLYIFLKMKFDIIIVAFIIYFLQAIFLKFINKQNLSSTLIEMIVAVSISYIFLIISTVLEFPIQKLCNIDGKILNLILTFLIETIFIYVILRIKRLRNALSFLENDKNEFIEIALINLSIFIIVTYGFVSMIKEELTNEIFRYFILLSICMIITVQKVLTSYYKQKIIDKTIQDYKEELKEKDCEIKTLKEETFKVSKINHEFYNRQKSLEMIVKNVVQNYKTEEGEDTDILNRIKEFTEEHSKKMSEIKTLPKLPLTEIVELDDMFKYMQTECYKNNIQFKLNINGNIYPLINNIISKTKLETLIGDHIRDAIVAINFSNNINKEIFAILGIKDNCYEFCVYDTGIEFEIDTLLKLGLEPITTHKDSGGSGIGFMTTFETLKECKASLIIEELGDVNKSNYTKAVKIRFDNKNEYRIHSYRITKLEEKCNTNRIIIKTLEENTISKN